MPAAEVWWQRRRLTRTAQHVLARKSSPKRCKDPAEVCRHPLREGRRRPERRSRTCILSVQLLRINCNPLPKPSDNTLVALHSDRRS
jgi:hypothetical protein